MSDYINKVKSLNLPKKEFMVCGSAIMEIYGIRKAKDIDLLVSPELFNKLEKEQRWKRHSKYPTTIKHPLDIAEAKQSLDVMKENYSLEEALSLATIIEDIPFMSLEMLLNAKGQMRREKDLVDIDLIKKYLAN